jgi:hypothetical protein
MVTNEITAFNQLALVAHPLYFLANRREAIDMTFITNVVEWYDNASRLTTSI